MSDLEDTSTEPDYKKLARARKARNARFARMTKAQQRVYVCKDLLKQMDSRKFVAEHMTYLQPSSSGRLLFGDLPLTSSAADRFAKIDQCLGCAIGGLLWSLVGQKNEASVGDLSRASRSPSSRAEHNAGLDMLKARVYLASTFSVAQQSLIERTFENFTDERAGGALKPISEKQLERLRKFRAKHASPVYDRFEQRHADELFRAILHNMIANHGTFRP